MVTAPVCLFLFNLSYLPGQVFSEPNEQRHGVIKGAHNAGGEETEEISGGRNVQEEVPPQFRDNAARRDHKVCIAGRNGWRRRESYTFPGNDRKRDGREASVSEEETSPKYGPRNRFN